MFGQSTPTSSRIQRWPIIIAVVVLLLVMLQMFRANRHTSEANAEPSPVYTQAGPLLQGQITIPAGEFHSQKLELNRRARILGTFRTKSLERRVSVLVLKERDVDLWKNNSIYSAVAETGYVPGGKIAPRLEPGGYLLVIDNRFSNEEVSVTTDFTME